jgi:hypothetical protein
MTLLLAAPVLMAAVQCCQTVKGKCSDTLGMTNVNGKPCQATRKHIEQSDRT